MNNVHFALDEAAELGHMDVIDSAIGIGRGYGARLMLCYQSLGQLRKCFPEGQEQVLLSNATQIFFAVNDNATADYVSARIGEETIVVASGGVSHGTSWQHSGGASPSDSHGGSRSTNQNWSLQARKLLKPEEVIALPANLAITFAPGVAPVCTRLLRYYEEPDLPALTAGRRSSRGVARSLLVITVLIFLAALLTLTIFEKNSGSTALSAKKSVERPLHVSPIRGVHHVQGRRTR